MTDERVLALLRAAQRMGCIALRWMPYPDEALEVMHEELGRDELQLRDDLNLTRTALKEVETALLNTAEYEGVSGERAA